MLSKQLGQHNRLLFRFCRAARGPKSILELDGPCRRPIHYQVKDVWT